MGVFLDFNPKSASISMRQTPIVIERLTWRKALAVPKPSKLAGQLSNVGKIPEAVQQVLRPLRIPESTIDGLTSTIAKWFLGSSDSKFVLGHGMKIIDVLEERRFLPEKGLYLSELLASFGFFKLSERAHRLARREISRAQEENATIRNLIRNALAAIVEDDFGVAYESTYQAKELIGALRNSSRILDNLAPLFEYVELWSSTPTFQGKQSQSVKFAP